MSSWPLNVLNSTRVLVCMMKLETSDLEILLDIAEVLLDLCLELAGGEQHLGRGSPVGDGAEQNLDQVRDLPRVVAGDGAVLALGVWILIYTLLYFPDSLKPNHLHTLQIAWTSETKLSAGKASSRAHISYKTQPRLHMSDLWLYGFRRQISGER